jgi:uncharacterized membrane protein
MSGDLLGGLAALLLTVLVIGGIALVFAAIVVVAARGLHRLGPASPERDPALDIARTRFAHGEIDEVEYERLRSVLQRH